MVLDNYKNLKRADNANKIAKHMEELQQCEFYLDILESQPPNLEQVDKAEQFANNIYEMLKRESPSIVVANTSPVLRNIDPVENLKINLHAIHRMLVEIMAKEANDITDNAPV